MKNIIIVLGLLGLLSMQAKAVRLDNMFVVSDEKGNGSYILSNDKDINYFIESSIRELITDEEGEYTKVEYTMDNILNWQVALSNNKLILEPGRSKSLGVKAICGDSCDFSEDKTFEIAIVPKPFIPEGEESNQTMSVYIGYAPVFIVPAKESILNYDIIPKGKNVRIHNKSNTMIRVVVDNCINEISADCRKVYTLIKGRAKEFPLPVQAVGKDLNVTVVNHNESKKETLTVKNKG